MVFSSFSFPELYMEETALLEMLSGAMNARETAYAPYSKFKVGAAAMGGSGKVYFGCNVENASYSLSVCAERVAILRAVFEGETQIRALVVVAGEDEIARPCGACLQVLSEFASKDGPTVIVAAAADGAYDTLSLDDYLPMRFELRDGS